MLNQLFVLLAAAILTLGAAIWALRAYRNGGGKNARASALFAGVVGLAAFGTYLALGRPDLPHAPYAARLADIKSRDASTYTGEEWIAYLSDAAKAAPDDPVPHFMLGQVYYANRRPEEAARAFDAALRRAPTFTPALLGLGRALTAIAGMVSPEAIAAFQQAAALDDADPTPWLYQAMAAMEAGDGPAAQRLWGEAYRRMSEDDPRREMALRMSQTAGEE